MSDQMDEFLSDVINKISTLADDGNFKTRFLKKIHEEGASITVQFLPKNTILSEKNSVQSKEMDKEYLELFRRKLKKRRSPRKQDEMPDPSKGSTSEDNKLHEKYQARVDPEINAMIDAFRKTSGLTKRQITEQALRLFVETYPDP